MPTNKQKPKRRLFSRTKNPIQTKADLNQFIHRSIVERKFHSGILKFSSLYNLRRKRYKYLFTILIGMFMATASTILVQSTGLYTGGTGALFQGIARLTYSTMHGNKETALVVYNALYWGLYGLMNIPLTIFAYKKIGKAFAIQSIVFILSTQLWGFIFSSGFFVPSFGDALHSLQLFGATSTVNQTLNEANVQSIVFFPNYVPFFINSGTGAGSFDWNCLFTQNIGGNDFEWVKLSITDANITRAMLLFIYAIVYSMISGICYTLVFILGGSTAGSDYITIYLSQVRNKDVGRMFVILNTAFMTVGILLGSYVSGGIIGDTTPVFMNPSAYIPGSVPPAGTYANYWGWQYIFSANYFASVTWVIMNGMIINRFFPWHKLARVEVYSSDATCICNRLKTVKYTHPSTVVESKGGFSGAKRQIVVTICMVIELPELIKHIRSVDEKCLISSNYISDIDGHMMIQRHTN